MKLRTKTLTLFITLFSCGFILLLFSTTIKIKDAHQIVVDSFVNQTFEFKSQEISGWLDQRVTELRMIASSVENQNIKKTLPYISELNQYIGKQYGNEWGTFAIGYTDGIGWINETITINISQREYFKEAMHSEAEYVLSTPVISKTDNTIISLICYPLRNQKNEIYGFINAAVSLDKLTELVKQIDFYNGKSWIMDSNGTIYTPTNIEKDNISLLISKFNNKKNTNKMFVNGNNTIFYTPINSTKDWFLCTAVKTSFLTKDTNHLIFTLIMIYLFVLSLVIVCCTIFSKSITNPIQELSETMHFVEQGDFSKRSQVIGKDEISYLATTFNKMIAQIQNLMHQVVQDEKDKRNAELRILQAQINPHFLYNTLDTLQWKAYESNNNEMVTMIKSLSSFFRISLSKGKEFIPIEKEIEHVKSYLEIQHIRFNDILSYEFDIQIQHSVNVLKLILQPLVENALQHGIKPKLSPGTIKIHVYQQNNIFIFEVEDNGVGMSKERLNQIQTELINQSPNESYGLINISNRIKLVYGNKGKVEIFSTEGKGTLVRIQLTIEGENNYV